MPKTVTEADRLDARRRPEGQPVMHQNWGKLHFMHWRINENILRPLIHRDLHIDTFDGSAWIAIAPFTMWDVRGFPPFIPAIPGLSSMHELNVRTYVHLDGIPGVWFFSLHIDSAIAAVAARTLYHLPYYTAEIDLAKDGELLEYELKREEEPAADFSAAFRVGKKLPIAQPGSREFFLTERYLLYTQHHDELYRARIHHQPWLLQESEVTEFSTTLFDANGIVPPTGDPIVHYAEEVNVDIWMIEKVSN